MSEPFVVTVCGTCGGSGEITVYAIAYGDDKDDIWVDDAEVVTCDNCAGSGWEPPTDGEETSDDSASRDIEPSIVGGQASG